MSPGIFVLLFTAFHAVLGIAVLGLAAWVMHDEGDGQGESDDGGDGGVRPRPWRPRSPGGRRLPLRRSEPRRPVQAVRRRDRDRRAARAPR